MVMLRDLQYDFFGQGCFARAGETAYDDALEGAQAILEVLVA